ncbi:MAG: hypothetical protein ABI379_01520 [Rhodanobacter sp.]
MNENAIQDQWTLRRAERTPGGQVGKKPTAQNLPVPNFEDINIAKMSGVLACPTLPRCNTQPRQYLQPEPEIGAVSRVEAIVDGIH